MASEAGQDFTDSAVRQWAAIVSAAELAPLDVTMRLRRAAIVLHTLMEDVCTQLGLGSLGEYDVLSILRRSLVSLSPSDLADRLMVTRSGMTGRLGRLEHLGLIERTIDPDDGRGQIIVLTRKGKARAERVFRALLTAQGEFLSVLGETEQTQLAAHLRGLLIAAEDDAVE